MFTKINDQANNEVKGIPHNQSSSKNQPGDAPSLIGNFATRDTTERVQPAKQQRQLGSGESGLAAGKQRLVRRLGKEKQIPSGIDEYDNAPELAESDTLRRGASRVVDDFNDRLAEQNHGSTRNANLSTSSDEEVARNPSPTESSLAAPRTSVVQNAFDRMRPRRNSPELATITIGSKTTTSVLGSFVHSQPKNIPDPSAPTKRSSSPEGAPKELFSSSMQAFAAPGSNFIRTVGLPQSKARHSRSQIRLSTTETSEDSQDDGSENDGQGLDEESQADSDGSAAESSAALESDDYYVDEDEKKAMEEAKVTEMIRRAEEAALMHTDDGRRRVQNAMKSSQTRDSTTELVQKVDDSIERIRQQLQDLQAAIQSTKTCHELPKHLSNTTVEDTSSDPRAIDSLTLTVTKADFSHLHIIGQFNLGFILATRNNTDLFIIDQHASDEKINFERLQATTIMQNQRLVHAHRMELTAVDEETILENQDILLRNGFVVDIDESGDVPVGQRVSLLSLPMSKETTFAPSDLEELIALLADAPAHSSLRTIPRPTKIRKLLAMRACRSSIMIGKVMTRQMMQRLVARMGEIDKPWNCPHGRPTMRHVCGLEGVGDWGEENEEDERVNWNAWIEGARDDDVEGSLRGMRDDEAQREDEGEDIEDE